LRVKLGKEDSCASREEISKERKRKKRVGVWTAPDK
jgi:hypothetical protein